MNQQNAELIIELLGYAKEYEEIKEEAESKGIDFNSIGSVIAKFLVRFQIFYLQTKEFDTEKSKLDTLNKAKKKIKACLTNDVQKMVSELKKEYPEVCDDSKMEEILLEFQFGIGKYTTQTGNFLSRCLLAIVDKALGGEATYSDYKEATIDHTEAQSKKWGYTSEKPAEDAIYSLGNLALLEEEYNIPGPSFNGNHENDGDWHVKRETYLKKSKFESTKRTAENHERWTEKDIKEEGKTSSP